jgi:hypothetical protein
VSIERKYKKEDQDLIDKAVQDLKDYEANLIGKLTSIGYKGPDLYRKFMNDQGRNLLISNLCHLHSAIVPSITLYDGKDVE